MSVIIILLLVSICIAGGFLVAFLWSVNDGQFDDAESPAQRMLFDPSTSSVSLKNSISSVSLEPSGELINKTLSTTKSK